MLYSIAVVFKRIIRAQIAEFIVVVDTPMHHYFELKQVDNFANKFLMCWMGIL